MPELSHHLETAKTIYNLAEMPKAELHLHLEGSPRWRTLRAALARHRGLILPESPPMYAPQFRFGSFAEFISCFRNYLYPWIATPSGYAELINDVVDSIIEQRIRYAELNFSVTTVGRVGGNVEAILEGLEEAVERARSHSTILRIFIGIARNEGTENASYWVRKLSEKPVVAGFDLHGDEVGWPAELFREAFAPAREAGKKIKAHAGEMVGHESILSAVEGLGVNQIGHGTTAIQNLEVVELLRDRRVVVEMCPTSNERLKTISSYHEHPLLELDKAGVAVTVNSDDPSWFGLDLTGEMARLIAERGVSADDLARWTRNAFQAAIVDEETRSAFLTELEQWRQDVARTESESKRHPL